MTNTSKYQQIAQQLITAIEQQQLAVNSKLPSLRAIMSLHQVSMTTAIACYRHMEQLGYAVAEHKKGFYAQKPYHGQSLSVFPHFNSTVVQVPESCGISYGKSNDNSANGSNNLAKPSTTPTVDISLDSLATAKIDTQLIDDSLLKQSIHNALKTTSFSFNYGSPQGNNTLLTQLSHHFTVQGFTTVPHELMITNGCLDAVVTALEVVSNPGDIIAVSSPCYSGLLNILTVLKRAVIEIPSTENGLDLEQLQTLMEEKKISACLLTANFQNPTGHSLSNEQKALLATLAAKYQIPIIEDDVFRELAHQKNIPLPIKYYDHAGWVLWCGSFSKTLAPGLRLGWCKPGRFLPQYLTQREVKTLGVNQPLQLALADYIAKGHYRRHLNKVNKALAAHSIRYVEYLQAHLPEHSEIYFPKGGLVLWINIPGVDGQQLVTALANHHVYLQQGNTFSTTPLYQHCIRINIGLIPNQALFAQLAMIVATVAKLLKLSRSAE